MTSSRYACVSRSGSIRPTRNPAGGRSSTQDTCAAGSVVLSQTGCPRRASSRAMAAATVVFPTPPLPIVMMTPLPGASSSSTNRTSGAGTSRRPTAGGRTGPAVAPSANSVRRAVAPSSGRGLRAISCRGSAPSAPGMVASASWPRHSNATAARSSVFVAWKMPFKMSRWLLTPSSRSSRLERSASRSDDTSARLTSINVVRAASPSVWTEAR